MWVVFFSACTITISIKNMKQLVSRNKQAINVQSELSINQSVHCSTTSGIKVLKAVKNMEATVKSN